ncbi:MAG: FG-GAP-like repeat-containing protein [Candidatus Binataceae bacterium]
MSKRWVVAIAGIALLACMAGIGKLYSDTLISMAIHAVHGGALPHRVWLPAQGSRPAMLVKRMRPNFAEPDTSSPPIEFLGAESYIAGVGSPFWESPSPVPYLKRESDCSLTAYFSNLIHFTSSSAQSNYQDVLHQQAALTTTGDTWPDGCVDSKLGAPSDFAAIGESSSGIFYGALALTYGLLQSQTSVTTAIGNSSATAFASKSSLAVPGTPTTLTLVDVNSDGKPDLIAVSGNDETFAATISVFLGNGDGTYQTGANYVTNIITGYVTVADVNNDGFPDLVVVGTPVSGNLSDPAVQVFLNNGHGIFGSAMNGPALTNNPSFVRQAAAVANFDSVQNSNADIATNDGYVLLGDGSGKNFTVKGDGPQFQAADNLVAADFNHDNKIDIATVNGFGFRIGISLGKGDGTFTAGQEYASIFNAANIGVSDIDGDGFPDLIVGIADPHGFGPTSDSASYTYFLLGRGDGTFAGAPLYPAQSAQGTNVELGPAFALADVNNDTKLDIMTVNVNGGSGQRSLYTLLNNGEGAFTPGSSTAISVQGTANDPALVLSGDLTNDNKMDAIVAVTTQDAASDASGTGNLAVFLGSGSDSFGTEMDTPIASTAAAAVTGDFNNDTNLDVIVGGLVTTDVDGNPTAGAIYFLAGQKNGLFAAPARIGTAENTLNPVSFAVDDLNGDKNLDLVVADAGAEGATSPVNGSVLVYLGNGNGTFQAPKVLDAPAFPQSVAIADVNHDGNLDIIVSSVPPPNLQIFASRIYVFLGDGKGGFGNAIVTTLDEFTSGMQVADLNGDGFPDLAIASCCGFANSEVWAGKGDGTFNTPNELPVAISSSFPVIGNVSGGANPDVLFAVGTGITALNNISGEGIPTPISTGGGSGPTPTATPTSGKRSPTPTATPTPGGSASLTAGPATLQFGNVDATTSSKPKKVKLTNKGTATAQIASVTATGPFTIGETCAGQSIAPKKSCTFEVEFAPATVEASIQGSVDVTYNGASPSIALEGTGEAVTLKVPTSAGLSSISAGSIGKAKNIEISNSSAATVMLATAALGGADAGSFKISSDGCSGHSLAAKGKCAIAVEFAPPGNATGTQSATLSLGFSYGANSGSASTSLSGKVK